MHWCVGVLILMICARIVSSISPSLHSQRCLSNNIMKMRSMSMMQSFSFLSPRLVIGAGSSTYVLFQYLTYLFTYSGTLSTALQSVGINKDSKILVVSGASNRHSDILSKQFKDNNLIHYHVKNEPTVENAIECSKIGRDGNVDYVISIGGGSAIDLGKVVAALITNDDDIYNYLEVVGKGNLLIYSKFVSFYF